MALHDRDMDGIACTPVTRKLQDLGSAQHIGLFDRQYVVNNFQNGFESRLDCSVAVDRPVTVQDFLENFGVGDESLIRGGGTFQQNLAFQFCEDAELRRDTSECSNR
jgi:hypothetical protein